MSNMAEPNPLETMPPTVGKRNNFQSLECVIDAAWDKLPETFRIDAMRTFLRYFAARVEFTCQEAYRVATTKALEQAGHILRDPNYYATQKQRRQREMDRRKQAKARWKQEQLEAELCPTAEQIEKSRTHLTKWIADSEKNLERLRAQLAALPESKDAKMVRINSANIKPWVVVGLDGKRTPTQIRNDRDPAPL